MLLFLGWLIGSLVVWNQSIFWRLVLVLLTFECSPWCLYTLMPKDWNEAFFSVEEFCCLVVCWVMPSRVLVFVYLLEICVDLMCSSSVILVLLILFGWGFYIAWSFFCTFIFLKKTLQRCFCFALRKQMWAAGICCDSAVCFSSLEWKGVSRHMARHYAEPSLASLHQSEQWYH